MPQIYASLYIDYTTQGARFIILEEYGCSVFMIRSIIVYLLVFLVPMLLILISLLFYTRTYLTRLFLPTLTSRKPELSGQSTSSTKK